MTYDDTYCCLQCWRPVRLTQVLAHYQRFHADEHAAEPGSSTAPSDPVDGSRDGSTPQGARP